MIPSASPSRLHHILFTVLGPGILMAGAAVGVSHLVQSTRAGADYGWWVVIFVLAANIFKYPFFEYGHRYAAATGNNLLDGYHALGKGYLHIFLILNVVTSIGSTAAVATVTAALAKNLLGLSMGVPWLATIILLGCLAMLLAGHYQWLDRLIKALMVLLLVATCSAFIAALWQGGVAASNYIPAELLSMKSLPFLIALMGWMPGPMEMSVWQSLWMQAHNREQQQTTTMADAKLDFNISYGLTVLLAVLFVGLGVLTMYGSGTPFANASDAFAAQVIAMYTSVIGAWSWPIIAVAAFAAMFSTTLTLVDAYPRSLATGFGLIAPSFTREIRNFRLLIAVIMIAFGVVIVQGFGHQIKVLVDIVTIVSFLAAPFFAWLNFRVLRSHRLTPASAHPGRFMRYLSKAGLVYLIGFGLLYISILIT